MFSAFFKMSKVCVMMGAMTTYADAIDHPALTAAAGLAALAVAALLARHIWRHRYRCLFAAAMLISLGLTVDGMYHLATGPMGLHGPEALLPAVFFESIGLFLAHKAEERLKSDHKSMGGYGPVVVGLGIFAAFLAAFGGGNFATAAARWAAPVVVVAVWWVVAHGGDTAATSGRFRWTPTQLLIAIGAIEPGDSDITDTNREWQIRRVARAIRLANGGRLAKWWGGRLLVRRMETVTPGVLAEARVRAATGHVAARDAGWGSATMRRVIEQVSAVDAGHPVAVLMAAPVASDVAGSRPDGGHSDGQMVADSVAGPWPFDGRDGGQPAAGNVAGQAAGQRPDSGHKDGQDVDPDAAQKELVRLIRRGQRVTRSTVMGLYDVSDGTAGRWLSRARTAASTVNGKRI